MIKRIGAALCVAFMLWVGLSWVDITADNCEPNPVHSQYNFFVVAFDR